MSELTERIRSAGYWLVQIHPTVFREKGIPNIQDLYPIIQRCVVEVRGWDFPHLDSKAPTVPHLDFIEQESEWQQFAERWRFYQSGQFVLLRAMPYDWRDRSTGWRPDQEWKRGAALGIGEALFDLFEVFEFAARLSNTAAGDDRMNVAITVGGLKGRRLVVDDPMRVAFERASHVAEIDTLPLDCKCSRTDLLANPAELAVVAARELFARFNRNIPVERLTEWLQTLRKQGSIFT
jgi:hypothetical protein